MRPESIASRLLRALAASPAPRPSSLLEHSVCRPSARYSWRLRVLRPLLSALANELGSDPPDQSIPFTRKSTNGASYTYLRTKTRNVERLASGAARFYSADIIDFKSHGTHQRRRVAAVALATVAIIAAASTGISLISAYVGKNNLTTSASVPFTYKGPAFDTCAAPSASHMSRWLASPYRAVFVYIGGVDRACAQRNLNSSWVKDVESLGWTVIPSYVGRQVASREINSANAAAALGSIAADDAIRQMQRLGLPPNTPLFYDLEAYPRGRALIATTLIDAWDKELNSNGYYSGLYTTCSQIGDFINAAKRITEPDTVDVACWNGSPSLALSESDVQMWPRRYALQISGNVTEAYGGATMDINVDEVNISLPPRRPAPDPQNG